MAGLRSRFSVRLRRASPPSSIPLSYIRDDAVCVCVCVCLREKGAHCGVGNRSRKHDSTSTPLNAQEKSKRCGGKKKLEEEQGIYIYIWTANYLLVGDKETIDASRGASCSLHHRPKPLSLIRPHSYSHSGTKRKGKTLPIPIDSPRALRHRRRNSVSLWTPPPCPCSCPSHYSRSA